MPASTGNKRAKTEKGEGKAADSKTSSAPKSQAKKEGTRWGTIIDTRGAGNKKSGAGSRDRLRDGT